MHSGFPLNDYSGVRYKLKISTVVTYLLLIYLTGSSSVAQAYLEFMVLLPQPAGCWEYRCASSWLLACIWGASFFTPGLVRTPQRIRVNSVYIETLTVSSWYQMCRKANRRLREEVGQGPTDAELHLPRGTSVLLLRPSAELMRPVHMNHNLFDSRSTDLKINLI